MHSCKAKGRMESTGSAEPPVRQRSSSRNSNAWVHTINVIHLSRATKRKRAFFALNKIDGLTFKLVEGIDSRLVDCDELKRQNLIKAGTTFRTPGCGLTHRKLWLQSVETQTPLIVCEDDAVIRHDFREQFSICMNVLPKDWDFLLLGYNFDSILEVEIIAGTERLSGRFTNTKLAISGLKEFQTSISPVSVLPLRNAFGTPGYAVSPTGARYLLRNVFPLRNLTISIPYYGRTMESRSIDSMMNGLYGKMKAFACLPPLVATPNQRDPHARFVKV